ncbi:unnamed protein product [Didymodactylos carnosus]|uniref:Uncharacterized protein n=2 Tax=Didymodactylos carnosus TaxID=1234261 RepID=A0A814PI21_9BILA|nr:unnamed protein product [Didymodactylos carnosus]CAF3869093.1 unnamed protein product [Didymodactylos carnosus]
MICAEDCFFHQIHMADEDISLDFLNKQASTIIQNYSKRDVRNLRRRARRAEVRTNQLSFSFEIKLQAEDESSSNNETDNEDQQSYNELVEFNKMTEFDLLPFEHDQHEEEVDEPLYESAPVKAKDCQYQ